MRRAIWRAFTCAVQFDPMFRAYYEKKNSERLHYMNAIGHVSRKMTAVIFAVLRDGRPYRLAMPKAGDNTSGLLEDLIDCPLFRYGLIHTKSTFTPWQVYSRLHLLSSSVNPRNKSWTCAAKGGRCSLERGHIAAHRRKQRWTLRPPVSVTPGTGISLCQQPRSFIGGSRFLSFLCRSVLGRKVGPGRRQKLRPAHRRR